jgi:hypothetical protein
LGQNLSCDSPCCKSRYRADVTYIKRTSRPGLPQHTFKFGEDIAASTLATTVEHGLSLKASTMPFCDGQSIITRWRRYLDLRLTTRNGNRACIAKTTTESHSQPYNESGHDYRSTPALHLMSPVVTR